MPSNSVLDLSVPKLEYQQYTICRAYRKMPKTYINYIVNSYALKKHSVPLLWLARNLSQSYRRGINVNLLNLLHEKLLFSYIPNSCLSPKSTPHCLSKKNESGRKFKGIFGFIYHSNIIYLTIFSSISLQGIISLLENTYLLKRNKK